MNGDKLWTQQCSRGVFGGQDELNTPSSPSSLARMGSHFVTREAFGLGKVKEDRKK